MNRPVTALARERAAEAFLRWLEVNRPGLEWRQVDKREKRGP
jgi:hypothetical protein